MRHVVLAALLASPTLTAAEPCAIIPNHAVVLTPDGAAIADGGGIVVATEPKLPDVADHGEATGWTLDRTKVTLARVGPGLEVITTAGAALRDADGKAIVAVKHGKPPALEAPGVARVEQLVSHGKHPFSSTTAILSADPPAYAVAMIVLDTTGNVRSWGRVAANVRSVVVFSAGGCATPPSGTVGSSAGEQIRLAWLDASGRQSKPTATIQVVEVKSN